MLNDEIKKIKDKKIAIKKIRTSFEERKMRGQAKILNWMAKLKIFISNYKWIQNKKKIKRMRIKLKKNKDYRSKDEIENKLKFDKRANNQN